MNYDPATQNHLLDSKVILHKESYYYAETFISCLIANFFCRIYFTLKSGYLFFCENGYNTKNIFNSCTHAYNSTIILVILY